MRSARESERVVWLLTDLCTELGYSMAARNPEQFERLVPLGPEAFAAAVLVAEGLDPEVERRRRAELQSFVSARFALWAHSDSPDS